MAIQVDPMMVITKLRERLSELEYENAVYKATVEKMQEDKPAENVEAAKQESAQPPSYLPKSRGYSKEL